MGKSCGKDGLKSLEIIIDGVFILEIEHWINHIYVADVNNLQ